MNFFIKNFDKSNLSKRALDYFIKKILHFGLKLPVYLTPLMIIYLLVAPQINSKLVDSLNSPFIIVFLLSQYFFLFILRDIFIHEEVKKMIRKKINWLSTLKNELVEQRITSESSTEKYQNLIEKYRITQLFKYKIFTTLFVFSDFSMTYDIQLVIKSSEKVIDDFFTF